MAGATACAVVAALAGPVAPAAAITPDCASVTLPSVTVTYGPEPVIGENPIRIYGTGPIRVGPAETLTTEQEACWQMIVQFKGSGYASSFGAPAVEVPYPAGVGIEWETVQFQRAGLPAPGSVSVLHLPHADGPNAYPMVTGGDFVPATKQFGGDSSYERPSLGPITSYHWDFGDGHTADGMNVEHTYLAPGSYTPSLTVADAAARSDTEALAVQILQGINPGEILMEAPYPAGEPTQWIAVQSTAVASETCLSAGQLELSYAWWTNDGSGWQVVPSTVGSSILLQLYGGLDYQLRVDVTDCDGNQATAYSAPFTTTLGCPYVEQPPVTVTYAPDPVDGEDPIRIYSEGPMRVGPAEPLTPRQQECWQLAVHFDGEDYSGSPSQPWVDIPYPEGRPIEWSSLDYELTDPWTTGGLTVLHLPHANGPNAYAMYTGGSYAPADVTFYGHYSSEPPSVGQITNYHWDFGDGESAEGVTVPHTYPNIGQYSVTLTVSDAQGRSDRAALDVWISEEPDPLQPGAIVVDSMLPADNAGHLDVHVSSTAVASEGCLEDGNPWLTYEWSVDFSQGSGTYELVSEELGAWFNGAEYGSYPVRLHVQDCDMQEATLDQVVTLGAWAPRPVAVLESDYTAGLSAPQAFSFDASASTASNDYPLVEYLWSSNDGWAAYGATASHTFTRESTTVSLRVKDAAGRYAYADLDIDLVVPPPVAVASITSPESGQGIAGLPIEFRGADSYSPTGAPIVDYEWAFYEGCIAYFDPTCASSQANPTHTYDSPGDYPVTLRVRDGSGQRATAYLLVHVAANQPPTAYIAAVPLLGSPPLVVTFDGSGSTDDAGVTSWQWDFGDGRKATGVALPHIYEQPGTYTATLTVRDAFGLSDTEAVVITVRYPPVAAFTATPDHLTPGTAVAFNASGSYDPDGTITGYAWNFGDSTVGTGVSPTHTYTALGAYPITLSVTDNDGMVRSVTHSVVVAVPSADVAVAFGGSQAVVKSGTEIRYTGTVRNNGPDPANQVRLTVALASTLTYVSATPSPTNGVVCQPPVAAKRGTAASPLTCTIATLASAQQVSFSIVAKVASKGIKTVATDFAVAPIGGTYADPVATNDTQRVTVTW